jgi:uncharacterized damage-inducible protein DinB
MKMNEAIASIHSTMDKIVDICLALPEDVIRRKPAEDKWSIMEILCHVEEAAPYWLQEIEMLLKAPGSEWGRGLQHEGRLTAVEQAGSRSVQSVLEGLADTKQQVQQLLGSLSEADLAMEAPSRNPRFGTKPIFFIVEHLLVEHVTKHLGQINRNLKEFEQ